MRHDPVRLEEAALRLGKAPATIRVWGTRYQARRFTVCKTMYWDYVDLSTIDAYIHRGEPVPATPEERDALRERLRASYAGAA